MKKLVLVIPSLSGGGSERVFSILANELSKYYQIKLILLRSGGVYLKNISNDVQVIQLNSSSILKSVPRLIQTLKKLNPDVTMSTLGSVNLIMAMIRPFIPNTKLIARESSILSINNRSEKYPKIFDLLFRVFYKKIDLIICQSKFMQKDMVSNFNVDERKTIVINNPVYFSSQINNVIDRKNKSYNFIAVGRLEQVKGYDLLLDALKLAVDKGADVKVTILGDGSQRDKLVEKSNELYLENNVNFAGFVSEPSVYMKDSDALIISSRYEGFPNVVLEAGANGLPVLGFNCPGGISEIINDSKLGVLVDNFNLNSLANEIINFSPESYSHDEIISSTKKRYSSQEIVNIYRSAIQSMIEG